MKNLKIGTFQISMKLLLTLSIGSFLVYYFYYRNKDTKAAQKELEDKRGGAAGAGNAVNKNYDKSTYKDFANAIQGAIEGLGTDSEAIEDVIRKLKSNADAVELDKAFNIRNKHSLGSWLSSDYELSNVHQMLEEQSIDYRFPVVDYRAWFEF